MVRQHNTTICYTISVCHKCKMQRVKKCFVNFVGCTWFGLGFLTVAFQFCFAVRVYLFLFGSVSYRWLLVYIGCLCKEAPCSPHLTLVQFLSPFRSNDQSIICKCALLASGPSQGTLWPPTRSPFVYSSALRLYGVSRLHWAL